MCYNSCKYFWFNPVEGTDGCKKGKNPCPEEEPISHCCGAKINEDWQCTVCLIDCEDDFDF